MALKETIERLRASRGEPSDSSDLVTKWQGEVFGLYDQISKWLSPYIEKGEIALERRSKTAYEERTGSYEIDQLDVEIGDETVRLDPKGTVVIGARGRIDMSHLGTGNPLILVLANDQSGWNIVDRSKRSLLTPLTKDTFEAALDNLLEVYDAPSEPSL